MVEADWRWLENRIGSEMSSKKVMGMRYFMVVTSNWRDNVAVNRVAWMY